MKIFSRRAVTAPRRRWAARAAMTVGVVAVAVGVAGCGGNGSLLSTGAATQLTADLNQASSALTQYDCRAAESALSNFTGDVSELQGVNATLVSMLSEGARTLSHLAELRCPSSTPTTTTPRRSTTTASDTTTTASGTTTTTTTDTGTDTDTTPLTTTSTTSTTGGQSFDTTTATGPDTVSTASTPTTPALTPTSGGNGFDATTASGGTGVAGGDGQ